MFDTTNIFNVDSATINFTEITNGIQFNQNGLFVTKGNAGDSSFLNFTNTVLKKKKQGQL